MANKAQVSRLASLNPLTPLELDVLEAAESGVCFSVAPALQSDQKAGSVRAEIIERLLRGEEEWSLSTRGLWLEEAYITGLLDLSGLRSSGGIAPPLNLSNCHFERPPEFGGAALDALTLNGAKLPGLSGKAMVLRRSFEADDLVSDGPITLNYLEALHVSIHCLKPPPGKSVSVSLRGARIKSDVMLNGANLASDSHALNLDGAEVVNVFLSNALFNGCVRAISAKVRGQWIANCSVFSVDSGAAISLDGAEAIYVDLNCSIIQGEVRAAAATIGQWLALGTSIASSTGTALNLSSSSIASGLFLRDDRLTDLDHVVHRPTEIKGTINLIDAKIGGIYLAGAHITAGQCGARAGVAILAQDLVVHGALSICLSIDGRPPNINGLLDFRRAVVNGPVDLSGALVNASDGYHLHSEVRGQAISFRGALLGGVLLHKRFANSGFDPVTDGPDCDSDKRPWIQASGAGFGRPTRIVGRLDFSGATIRGDLEIEMAELQADKPDLHAPGREACDAPAAYSAATALSLHLTQILGALKVRLSPSDGDRCRGIVDLRGARCEELDDNGGDGWGAAPDWTNIAGVKVATGLVLDLDGFDYGRLEAEPFTPVTPYLFGFPAAAALTIQALVPAIVRGLQASMKAPINLWLWLIGSTPAPEHVPTENDSLWVRRRHWLERQYRGDHPTVADYSPQPWQHLARVLEAQGKDLDARRITIEHHRFQLRCSNDRLLVQAWGYVYGALAGFGYSPGRALSWAAGLALVGVGVVTLAFAADSRIASERLAIAMNSSVPTQPLCLNEQSFRATIDCPFFVANREPDKPWLVCSNVSPWLYALDIYLPLDLGQEARCDVPARRHLWGLFKLLFTLVGWIAVPLAALTFTGILRRS